MQIEKKYLKFEINICSSSQNETKILDTFYLVDTEIYFEMVS